MLYYKMDDLRVAVKGNDMFLHRPTEVKACDLSKSMSSKQAHDILVKYPQITKEEFESTFPTRNTEECMVKALYFETLNK